MSNSPAPRPSALRVILLLIGLAWRRLFNRASAGLRRRNRPTDGAREHGTTPRRRATPRKSSNWWFTGLLWIAIAALIGFQVVSMSSLLVHRTASLAVSSTTTDGSVWVESSLYYRLANLGAQADAIRRRQTEQTLTPVTAEFELGALRAEVTETCVRKAGGDILAPPDWQLSADEAARVRTIVDAVLEPSSSRLERIETEVFDELRDWPSHDARQFFVRAISTVCVLLFIALFALMLGSANQDLGKVDWTFEWLFGFPASARCLMFAKLAEYTIVQPMAWIVVLCFSTTLLMSVGYEWGAALALALVATLVTTTATAALRSVVETWLRLHLPPSRVKNLQALCTIVGILSLYAVLWLVIARTPPRWFTTLVEHVPSWLHHLPPAWIANFVAVPIGTAPPTATVLALLGIALLACIASVGLGFVVSAWLVRDGLVRSGGAAIAGGPEGRRRIGAIEPHTFGVFGKELRLWLRDRNFLVQTTVVPILIFGFQLLVNPGWLAAAAHDFQIAAVTAYGVGAYVLLMATTTVVNGEGNALWLLFTFPQGVGDVLQRKVKLWLLVALGYAVACMLLLGRFEATLEVWTYAGLVVLGLIAYAYIAAGLAVLGSDPQQQHMQRRMRLGITYVSMLVASTYSWAIFAESWWPRLTMLILLSALAVSIWQTVRDRIPFLLDPTAAPPVQISAIHGLIAANVFFVLQGLVAVVTMRAWPDEWTRAMTVAFLIAGVATALGCALVFTARGIRWFEELGLGRHRATDASRLGATLSFGLIGGLSTAALGALYLWLIAGTDYFRGLLESQQGLRLDAGSPWLVVLAIIAAPLVEEFLFRGVLFRGLRRSHGVGFSVVASALVFAVVHPPVSWLPVFVMGMAAAWTFERTGRLAAPILLHAIYNALVLVAQTQLLGS